MKPLILEEGDTLELFLKEDPNKSETYVVVETFYVEKVA